MPNSRPCGCKQLPSLELWEQCVKVASHPDIPRDLHAAAVFRYTATPWDPLWTAALMLSRPAVTDLSFSSIRVRCWVTFPVAYNVKRQCIHHLASEAPACT